MRKSRALRPLSGHNSLSLKRSRYRAVAFEVTIEISHCVFHLQQVRCVPLCLLVHVIVDLAVIHAGLNQVLMPGYHVEALLIH